MVRGHIYPATLPSIGFGGNSLPLPRKQPVYEEDGSPGVGGFIDESGIAVPGGDIGALNLAGIP